MKNRMYQFMQAEKVNALRFAEKLEVRPSSISHILSGRNNPSFDFIEKLLSKYPKLNPDWLLLGKGNMYRTSSQSEPSTPGLSNKETTDMQKEELAPESIVTDVKTLDNEVNAISIESENKEIDKIIILYTDGTFRDYCK